MQALMIVSIAQLVTYWLHRAAHISGVQGKTISKGVWYSQSNLMQALMTVSVAQTRDL